MPKSVVYFHAARALGFDEALPEAEHRVIIPDEQERVSTSYQARCAELYGRP